MKKRIFLTGASGFLGGNFCHLFSDEFDIIACYHEHPLQNQKVQSLKLDFTDKEQVIKAIEELKPDYIIHLGALSNPNECELDPKLSFRTNVLASVNLADIGAENAIPIVFASTDLVFDGNNAPYKESDEPNPLNTYAIHKSEAEVKLREIYPNVVICRLPLLYGKSFTHGKSFLQGMIESLIANKTVTLFTDEYRSPASAIEVCEGLKLALDMKGVTIHLGGNDRLSRIKIGEIVCKEFGFDKELLTPILQADISMPAKRPKDVSLNNSYAKSLGWNPIGFREELKKLAITLSFLFCVVLPVFAQSSLSNMPHTLLWKIEGKNGIKPSYLYGTMHTENDKAFTLMDSVLIDFNTCAGFAMEVNEDSLDPMKALAEMTIPDNKAISSLLSKTDYDKVSQNFSKATGLPMLIFDKVRPIYLWVMMSEGGEAEKTGNFLDIFFYKLAKQNKKQVYGLEQAEDQFKLLRDIPIETQLEMLKEGAENYKQNKAAMKQNYDAYKNADYATLMQEDNQDTMFGKDFSKNFITLRNHTMANEAEKLINKEAVFIAVGAAHLPGDEGVINLLRQKGYRVNPVLSKKRLNPQKIKKLLVAD